VDMQFHEKKSVRTVTIHAGPVNLNPPVCFGGVGGSGVI
jgi:hypothetical protein